MTNGPDTNPSLIAGRHKTHWPGLVWAVPLAALIAVSYLGLHAWARRGEVVTVTFKRAADAKPGETKVLYQGVEAGHLLKIVPNEDGHRLDFQLRLVPEAKAGLNSNARFWLIGASPSLADLSSLRAVVSGVAIGYAPGEGGTPTTTFEGLDKAPTVLPGDRGTRYLLESRTLGPIREGSGLLFHGQPIGKVTEVKFDGEAGFQLEVFVFEPYDALIKPGTRFWKMSPLHLSLAGGGLNASLAPASTLLSGGIEVETAATADSPDAVKGAATKATARTRSPADSLDALEGVATKAAVDAQSPANSTFTLYASRDAARQGLSGPTVTYDFAFAGAAGGLEEDAAVTLLGFQIGEVRSTHLSYDARTGKPFTTVTAVIYPRQLEVQAPSGAAATAPGSAASGLDWRAATDAKVRQLLRAGFRARLEQTPALVGSQAIALVEERGAAAADLAYDGKNPRIPSAHGSASVADITSQADQILAKINRVPIQEIGENFRQVTRRLNSLVSSPTTQQSLVHLTKTLAEVDQILGELQPQIGPLLSKLNEAAGQISGTALAAHQLLGGAGDANPANLPETIRQLDEAARSIRTLTDYLDRHPEALIRGKRPDK